MLRKARKGFETKEERDRLGLTKLSDKTSNSFEAHCVDSWVLANLIVGGLSGVSGLATWPKGRLVALQCDEIGEFATVAVIPISDRIRLNAMVKPTGYIKMAVKIYGGSEDMFGSLTDAKGLQSGHTFEDTDRLVGDSLAMPVTWKGDAVIPHQGKPIILRFQLSS